MKTKDFPDIDTRPLRTKLSPDKKTRVKGTQKPRTKSATRTNPKPGYDNPSKNPAVKVS